MGEWSRRADLPPGEALRKDAEEVARGSGIAFLGNFGKLSKSLYYVMLTRVVGAGTFGLYTLGWSLIELVGRIGLFGLDRGVVRFVARHRSDGDAEGAHRTIGQALTLGLTAGLSATVLLWVAAPWAAASVFHKPELAPILRLLAPSIPFLVLSSILLSALRALRIMKFDVYVRSLAEPFLLLTSAVVLCVLGWTMYGLALAYLVSAACGLLLALRYFGRLFSLSRCVRGMSDAPFRSPIAAFSAPLPLQDALANLMSRLDLFVLAAFVPAGTVGVYAATCEVAWVMKDIRQSFDPIFAPVASGLLHEGQRERLSALFASVTRWILILELAFLLGAILWGSAVLSIFGRSFPVGFASLLLLSAGFAINGAFGLSEVLLLMGGRSGLNLLNTALLAAVNLALNLTLVPRYGIEGAALSSAGSLTLINIVRVVQGRVLLGVHPFRRSLLKPLVAAGVATGVGLALMRLENPWSVASILSLPLYFGLLRALGLEDADHEMLEKLHARAPFLRRWALAWDGLGTRLNRIRPRRVPAPSRPADRDRPDDPSERPPSS